MEPTLQQRLDALKATNALPTPAGVALQVIELAQRDDISAAEVARAVGSDPALTARLLKLANSPNVRRRRPAVAIGDAVVLLGLHVVRQLALGLSVLDASRDGACSAFDYPRFWSHSLATAVAAEAIAARLGGTAPEEAFTAGLLSRVGALALATVYPEDYAPLVAAQGGLPAEALRSDEQARFAIDHLSLSQAMLADWGLPEVQVAALAGLYDPQQLDSGPLRVRKLAHGLHAASAFADLLSEAADTQALARARAALEAAGLDADDGAELYDEAAAQWREWAELLEVPTGGAPDFASLQQRLRERAEAEPPAHPHDAPSLRLVVFTTEDGDTLLPLLEQTGHAAAATAEPREAVRWVLEGAVDALLADAAGDPGQALALCRALRRCERGRYCYLAVYRAPDDPAFEREALQAGADDCIGRDAEPSPLLARLHPAARLSALRAELEHEREQARRFVGELAVANRRLEQAALTDVLTGLPNRRFAMQRLAQAVAAAARRQRPMACMLIDLDHFKAVNDTWGHATGDEVLMAVAERLRASARREDDVCRIGGEEFLVVCADADTEAARQAAERLRTAVEEAPVPAGDTTLPLTVSIGVAVSRAGQVTAERLLDVADKALYQAKRAGRNRTSVLDARNGARPGPRTSPP